MKTVQIELVRCNECLSEFPANELLMGQANDDHAIDDWHCPYCGAMDYSGVDDGEDEYNDLW